MVSRDSVHSIGADQVTVLLNCSTANPGQDSEFLSTSGGRSGTKGPDNLACLPKSLITVGLGPPGAWVVEKMWYLPESFAVNDTLPLRVFGSIWYEAENSYGLSNNPNEKSWPSPPATPSPPAAPSKSGSCPMVTKGIQSQAKATVKSTRIIDPSLKI